MTSSIYHFFEDLYQRRSSLVSEKIKPDSFPYKDELLSLKGSKGQFPDLAIRINEDRSQYTGGELIEVKDSTSGYNITSFNSTIPSGVKPIQDIAPLNSKIYKKMTKAGDSVFSLANRSVYYLLRGKKADCVKVCLIHGSFFETTSSKLALQNAFEQVIDEAISDNKPYLNIDFDEYEKAKNTLLKLDWKQSHFSSVRKIDKSSISVRFRVMSEVIAGANLLNPSQYPSISDNTLNLVLLLSKITNDEKIDSKMSDQKHLLSGAFQDGILPTNITQFAISHKLQPSWQYLVFQSPLQK